jgi:SAM-dependent methyltransferase
MHRTHTAQTHSRRDRNATTSPPPMPDWGIGRYERFELELEPAAAHVVRLADPRAGEEVLDIACGTGNAALLAARTGATVTGLDSSSRLLDVARERARAGDLEASFVSGDAQNLPFEDGAFDVVTSVFGVIFAPNAERALAEALRVLSPGGRAFISAWLPGGALDAIVGVITRAIGSTLGRKLPRFPWHEETLVREIAVEHHAHVRFTDGEIAFESESPESYLAAQEEHHPLSIAARGLLSQVGNYDAVRAEMLEALRHGNESARGFCATSRYRVIEFRTEKA